MWHVGADQGSEAVPPALGEQSLNRWTTRELPGWFFHFKKEVSDIMLVLHLATPPILFMLRLLKAFYI